MFDAIFHISRKVYKIYRSKITRASIASCDGRTRCPSRSIKINFSKSKTVQFRFRIQFHVLQLFKNKLPTYFRIKTIASPSITLHSSFSIISREIHGICERLDLRINGIKIFFTKGQLIHVDIETVRENRLKRHDRPRQVRSTGKVRRSRCWRKSSGRRNWV